jgi:hypothetical protein
MKVSVCARVTYNYEVEIPDGVDLECYADSADPVYPRFVKALVNEGLNYEGEIVSIVDAETDEVYYAE